MRPLGRLSALLGGLGVLSAVLLLLIHGLEIDLGQMHGREASSLNHIGHCASQVGVDNLWASNPDDGAQLFLGHIANFKNTGLFGLDQKDRFVLDFGAHCGGHGDFENPFIDRFSANLELDVHTGLLLREQNGG